MSKHTNDYGYAVPKWSDPFNVRVKLKPTPTQQCCSHGLHWALSDDYFKSPYADVSDK